MSEQETTEVVHSKVKERKKEKNVNTIAQLIEFNQDRMHTLRGKVRRREMSELEKDYLIAKVMASLQNSLEKADERSATDSLTKLRNRGAFNRRYDDMAQRGRSFGVLLLDIDHFKTVNDEHGHPAGDSVLFQVGMTVQDATRQLRPAEEEDMVARYGGEEIAILLPNVEEETILQMIAEKVRESISAQPFSVGDKEIPVTVSIGGGVFRRGDKDTFFKNVDAALYRAKDGGRNQSVIYSTELRVAA